MGGAGPPFVQQPSCTDVLYFGGDCTGEWARTVYQVFDVSAAAQSGAISLQLQLTNSVPGYTGSAIMKVSVSRFTMTPTPSDFRPRDSREPLTAMFFANQDNCNPSYTAGFSTVPFGPQAPITFTITPPTVFLNGLPSPGAGGPWLAGTSTNNGGPNPFPAPRRPPPNDDATVPDYVFTQASNPGLSAPASNGLSIQTSGPVPTVNVTIDSQDYGGRALLTATSQLYSGGPTITADIFDPNSPLPPAQSVTITGTCGPTGAPPYVNLPVDIDCDGIADWWEDAFSKPSPAFLPYVSTACSALSPLGHLPVNCDVENGPSPGASPVGDGFSVHDEYRGFHFLLGNDSHATVQWASTDPMNTKDVFFWDQSNRFATPLSQILSQQAPTTFLYWRVTASQANAIDQRKPEKGANPLTRFSVTGSLQFPIVYASVPGDQLDPGVIGDAQSQKNDGKAVKIALDRVPMAAGVRAGFPRATLVAEVVAHETGHKFGRPHPLRASCCSFMAYPVNQLTNLSQTQFTFEGSPSSTIYVRLFQYTALGKSGWIGDDLYLKPLGVSHGVQTVQVADSPNFPVYQVPIQAPGKITSATTHLLVQDQLLELMDWTPNLTLTAPNQWNFDPVIDLPNLCVRSDCP